MPHMYCEMQNKLSNTRGSPLGSMGETISSLCPSIRIHGLKGIYFVIYGIISEFTDKGQFQYLTNLKGPQEGTYLYTTQFLSLR